MYPMPSNSAGQQLGSVQLSAAELSTTPSCSKRFEAESDEVPVCLTASARAVQQTRSVTTDFGQNGAV